jgi:hypothetical protein
MAAPQRAAVQCNVSSLTAVPGSLDGPFGVAADERRHGTIVLSTPSFMSCAPAGLPSVGHSSRK